MRFVPLSPKEVLQLEYRKSRQKRKVLFILSSDFEAKNT